jgi:hypothetical protein
MSLLEMLGVILKDIWDASILEDFQPDVKMEDPHCPIIGAQEGFSINPKMDPKVISLLQDAQPLFFPEG